MYAIRSYYESVAVIAQDRLGRAMHRVAEATAARIEVGHPFPRLDAQNGVHSVDDLLLAFDHQLAQLGLEQAILGTGRTSYNFV